MIEYNSVTDIYENFIKATEKIENFTVKPTNEELLLLYGLYKQSKFGNNNTSAPFLIDIKNKAKWTAWNQQKNKTKIAAQEEYIAFVENLSQKYTQ